MLTRDRAGPARDNRAGRMKRQGRETGQSPGRRREWSRVGVRAGGPATPARRAERRPEPITSGWVLGLPRAGPGRVHESSVEAGQGLSKASPPSTGRAEAASPPTEAAPGGFSWGARLTQRRDRPPPRAGVCFVGRKAELMLPTSSKTITEMQRCSDLSAFRNDPTRQSKRSERKVRIQSMNHPAC